MGEIPETRVLQTIEITVTIVKASNTVSKTDKSYNPFLID